MSRHVPGVLDPGSLWKSLKVHFIAVVRWWWVIMVGVVGGAIGLGIDAAPSFSGGDLNVSLWLWVVIALAGIPVAQFLGFHQARVQRDARIRELEIELATPDSLADVLVVEPERRSWQLSSDTGPLVQGAYLSIRIANERDWEIVSCKMRLERLEYWVSQSSRWVADENFSPLLLAWSFNDGGGSEMTIGARSNRSCDLAAFEREDAEEAMIIAAQEPLRAANTLRFGRWRATCHVEADECLPLTVEATFVWEEGVAPKRRNLEFIEQLRVIDADGSALEGGSA